MVFDMLYDLPKMADRINDAAKQCGKSVARILVIIGAGKNTVANIRSGQCPSAVTLARIADELDVSVDYLLGRTDTPEVNRKSPE